MSGIPNHKLVLKIGAPVMCLRNIDRRGGLCNCTRLQIVRMRVTNIEAKIISGGKVGTVVAIPRMNISPSDKKMPFQLNRRQYSIVVCFAMTINKSQGQTLSKSFVIHSPLELQSIWSSFNNTDCKVKFLGGSRFSLEFNNSRNNEEERSGFAIFGSEDSVEGDEIKKGSNLDNKSIGTYSETTKKEAPIKGCSESDNVKKSDDKKGGCTEKVTSPSSADNKVEVSKPRPTTKDLKRIVAFVRGLDPNLSSKEICDGLVYGKLVQIKNREKAIREFKNASPGLRSSKALKLLRQTAL
ncbi:ATP-dependent DNA helicase PIF1-like protein [Tanacetum coccineum]|uniref:ATP-dependent DNA helicase PIF1-like protein n=1 Tax=Tanacetum coccineum TaxID=301880 RepID=A0ABQ5HZX1_9ASTR